MIEYYEIRPGAIGLLGSGFNLRANLNERVVFQGIEYIVMRIENNLDYGVLRIFVERFS